MKLTREQLLSPLRAGFRTPAGSPLDHAAIMFALALWESGGVLGIAGDKGVSLGLWQVHQPTWAAKIGAFPATDGDAAQRLSSEIDYVRPVLADMLAAVTSSIALVSKRAKAGERFTFSPIRDLPVWASVAWQYGAPTLRRWIGEATDLSARGFKRWRSDTGRAIQPDHDKRQAFISETYLLALERPERLLENLRKLSIAAGVDFFTNAARELKAKRPVLDAWARQTTGKIVRGALRGGAARKIATAGIAAAAIYWAATEPAPGGGRQLSSELQGGVTTIIGGLAMGAMAKAGLG